MINAVINTTTNISITSNNYLFVVRTPEIYFLSKYQVYNTLLINHSHHAIH